MSDPSRRYPCLQGSVAERFCNLRTDDDRGDLATCTKTTASKAEKFWQLTHVQHDRAWKETEDEHVFDLEAMEIKAERHGEMATLWVNPE